MLYLCGVQCIQHFGKAREREPSHLSIWPEDVVCGWLGNGEGCFFWMERGPVRFTGRPRRDAEGSPWGHGRKPPARGTRASIAVNVAAGTYYLSVGGISALQRGAFFLNVSCSTEGGPSPVRLSFRSACFFACLSLCMHSLSYFLKGRPPSNTHCPTRSGPT